ncbi:MAG TPA: hypothetical protein VMY77_18555 [Chitinophagaceae bacterium]|nr:hypothetical protein [Chitinophagaceae bacterium]
MKHADYRTEESLKYFRSEENRNLFVEWFENKELSNKNFVAIANVSSQGEPGRKVLKTVHLVWELHREKFLEVCKSLYDLGDAVLKAVYHETLTEVTQLKGGPDDTSFEKLFTVTAHKKLNKL